MTPIEFKDRVILVTGGASGIGLAVCRAMAKIGAQVAMVDMDAHALALQEQWFKDKGWKVFIHTCDVRDPLACRGAVRETLDHFGRLDILFNNAGITQRGLFEKTRTSVFHRVMDTNFYGALYMTKAAFPHLMASRGAIVVNESIAGVAPLLGRTGYAASKHALHGLFTSLRCELRSQGVHVMILCPGFIKTNLQTRALGADGNLARHGQTRVGAQQSPESVARAFIHGLGKKKSMVVLTPMGKLGYWVARLFPGLYESLMTWQFKRELSI